MQIKHTEDYSLFTRIKGNRGLNKSHIGRLVQAISQNAKSIKYTPIVVNERNQVIDGQHRLEASKFLNLPVYYIQEPGLGLSDVQGLNSMSKAWTPMDFARSYAEIGKIDYKIYIEFKKKYKLNHDILRTYLGLENPVTATMFKQGSMKVEDETRSHDLCSKLLEVGEFYPRYNIRSFAVAFKRAWDNKDYDHKHFMGRLAQSKVGIQDCALPEDYLRNMEKIYNYHSRMERIRFF